MGETKRTVLGLFRDKTFRNFFTIVKKYKWVYVWLISSQVLLTGLTLVFAETSRRLFDLAPNIPSQILLTLILVFLSVAGIRLVVTFYQNWALSYLNESVVYAMRRQVMNHLRDLPIGFHEREHSSNSAHVILNQLEIAKDFVVFDLQRIFFLPISFVMAGIYLLTVHPFLGVVAISIGPLQLISNIVLQNKFMYASELQQKVTRDVFHRIYETLHGIKEVKANQMELYTDKLMTDIEKKGVDYNVVLTKVTSIRSICREIPGQLGYVAGIGIGALLMAKGEIGPGGLVAFITLLDRVVEPFTTMVNVINNLQRSISGGKRFFEVMEMTGEDMDAGDPHPQMAPEIRFIDVSFEYNRGNSVLNHITFTVPAGSSVALVGPSGAGKSTLIKMLSRFYDPHEGDIYLNGKPLTDYSIQSIRANMALVSQDIHMFDGTILDNIRVGKLDATHDEVVRAAILAQAYDFISSLPEGFNTEVGERGVKLSHGQKQRISIARAVLRKASLLVLDEPTSALDVETEVSFQKDLGKWAESCTKIIIAHRLSTIREVDYVVFLEHGTIVEQGSPSQLLQQGGRFKDYWSKQGEFTFSA